MNSQLPKEDALRKYLLGVLGEPELSAIEKDLLSSEELAEVAEVVEDEIVEQYLDRKLDDDDKKAFETHFLRPPQHREKLRFARMLRHYAEKHSPAAAIATAPSPPSPFPGPRPPSPARAYGAVVIAILLGVLCTYLGVTHVSLQRKLKEINKEKEVLQAQLAEEQASNGFTSLELRPGVTRGSGSAVPKVRVRSTMRLIHVDVVLPAAIVGSFTAKLENDNENRETVWSQSGLRSVPSPPLATLQFDIPTRGIKPGSYDLVVALQNQASQIVYPFDIEAGNF